jgi:hypothetical protein
MPYPEWPATLPQDMLLGHTGQAVPSSVAFRPQVHAPTLYQVGDSQAHAVRGRLRVSDAQLQTFLEFYRETLRYGSRRFNWTSASFDGATMRLQFDEAAPYSHEAAAIGWTLDVTLWVVRQVA